MKVRVKTTGLLDEYLPPGSGNPADLAFGDGTTPMDVVLGLGMPADGKYLISLNGEVLPRSEHARRRLSENDTLAIMPPLKGG